MGDRVLHRQPAAGRPQPCGGVRIGQRRRRFGGASPRRFPHDRVLARVILIPLPGLRQAEGAGHVPGVREGVPRLVAMGLGGPEQPGRFLPTPRARRHARDARQGADAARRFPDTPRVCQRRPVVLQGDGQGPFAMLDGAEREQGPAGVRLLAAGRFGDGSLPRDQRQQLPFRLREVALVLGQPGAVPEHVAGRALRPRGFPKIGQRGQCHVDVSLGPVRVAQHARAGRGPLGGEGDAGDVAVRLVVAQALLALSQRLRKVRIEAGIGELPGGSRRGGDPDVLSKAPGQPLPPLDAPPTSYPEPDECAAELQQPSRHRHAHAARTMPPAGLDTRHPGGRESVAPPGERRRPGPRSSPPTARSTPRAGLASPPPLRSRPAAPIRTRGSSPASRSAARRRDPRGRRGCGRPARLSPRAR